MGLAISVMTIADAKSDDEEYGQHVEAEIKLVNQLLEENNLPTYSDPPGTLTLKARGQLHGFGYSWLHYLRRALAYQRNEEELSPVEEDEDPSDDGILEEEYYMLDSHLICHSDCEGFYVPLDFPESLYGTDKIEVLGGMVGSSHGLKRELIDVAPLIGIELDAANELSDAAAKALQEEQQSMDHEFAIERQVWFTLFEAANDSIKHGFLISFG